MLKKDTCEFLKALKDNNNREWFAENKEWYDRAKADFELLLAEMIGAIATFDAPIGQLDPKKCAFRIYRDVRFSPDKTPYKTHFSAIFRPIGMPKSTGYYFHIDAEESFICCGHYGPTPAELKNIRKAIYEDFDFFSSIINEKHFKEEIGDLYRDKDDVLKRVPNGFDKESPAAEYMKLKRFYVLKVIPEEMLFSKDLVPYAASVYKRMQPLGEFLNDLLLD